ncbi:unnamed protein product [Urochloa decumbens]|uniref:Serpin domain-containing protein n=1 Tax=Urochloa decumbens TaxID=240449 RepID=A0ABC8YTY6_9POAL
MNPTMQEEEEARPSKKARPDPAAGSGLTPFALRLAKQLSNSKGKGDNLVFSPLSVYAALALVAAGARGETLGELLALLGASSRDELAEFAGGAAERALADRSGSGGPLVAFACGVWHAETVALKPDYRAAAVESYKAETRAADFHGTPEEARKEINRWVSEATNGLITSILPEGSVHPETAMVLANAIYFKGMWFHPFDKEETKMKLFYCLDGSSVRVPFMRSDRWQFVEEHDGFKVLKLPYRMQQPQSGTSPRDRTYRARSGRGGNVDECHYEKSDECPTNPDERPRLSMCVFLPDDRKGLPSLVDKMSSSPSFLQDHLPTRRFPVTKFRLPKFKFSLSSKMNDVLKAMGLKVAFDKHKADLSDMLMDDGGMFMENVFHEAVIEVNEEGTEAAASTACTTVKKCAAPTPVDFVADHPFAFFVVEEVSGAIIFMGYCINPATRVE